MYPETGFNIIDDNKVDSRWSANTERWNANTSSVMFEI